MSRDALVTQKQREQRETVLNRSLPCRVRERSESRTLTHGGHGIQITDYGSTSIYMVHHRDNTANASGAIYSHARCDFGRQSTRGSKTRAPHKADLSGSPRPFGAFSPSGLVFMTIELISPQLTVPERQMERARRGLERLTWCGCARYTV